MQQVQCKSFSYMGTYVLLKKKKRLLILFLFFSVLIISFFLNLFILIGGYLLYNIVVVLPYIDMNQLRVYMCAKSWTPLPPSTPSHPSGSSQGTGPELPVSCIKPGLAIYFTYTYTHIHVSVLFSQIIPPSPLILPTTSALCFSFNID